MTELEQLRTKIDSIDTELVKLFEERQRVSEMIGAYKASRGMPVFDAAREEQKIAQVRELASSEEYASGIEELFRAVMAVSRSVQNRIVKQQPF